MRPPGFNYLEEFSDAAGDQPFIREDLARRLVGNFSRNGKLRCHTRLFTVVAIAFHRISLPAAGLTVDKDGGMEA